ncbi:MAG: 5-(carboxyamino)imidazole ribonucleotide synthase [Cytophagaceae bacterium]|nr:5-(carboxyamino)imidazole ribonucleotide synthase [Cytophagaceae bacterium]
MGFKNNTKIGILGGGQLGKMLIQAALDFDLDVSVLENDAHCPCAGITRNFVLGDIMDFDTVYNFGKTLDVITIEIENVNIEALKKLEAEGKMVYPQPAIVETIKDKTIQKQFFADHNIQTSDLLLIENKEDAKNKIQSFPVVNKIGVGGYDGRGVQIIRDSGDIEKVFNANGIIEQLIDFEKELAVIVARNPSGSIVAFPVVEMVFHPEANLVEYLFSPANISTDVEEKAKSIAKTVAEKFGIVGLLAVEMFLTKDGQILVNEVAPRPHNSGHHTQKANLISQFDMHWRAILDLPLVDLKPVSTAAMVNILGEPGYEGAVNIEGMDQILGIEGVFPFFYGKKTTKPFRKMGHVTILDSNFDNLIEKVNFVKDNLKVISK